MGRWGKGSIGVRNIFSFVFSGLRPKKTDTTHREAGRGKKLYTLAGVCAGREDPMAFALGYICFARQGGLRSVRVASDGGRMLSVPLAEFPRLARGITYDRENRTKGRGL